MGSASPAPADAASGLQIEDLGRMSYTDAYARQCAVRDRVLAARNLPQATPGVLLLVEHDPPVITVSKRPGALEHLLATEDRVASLGVTVEATDRGGDITYHGPGQLIAYPILDLNALGLNLHAYMRLLEQIVIDVCDGFGVAARRDSGATGVWVGPDDDPSGGAKLCAMGVRVRRWVTMHGLALNVTTNLDHFDLIVPCGLTGRPVTSLARQLGDACPSMGAVKAAMSRQFAAEVAARVAT